MCGKVLDLLGVVVEKATLPPATLPQVYTAFSWGAVDEPDHAEGERGYIAHIKKHFITAGGPLDVASVSKWKGPTPLWHLEHADGEVNGGTDAVIYVRGQDPPRVLESRALVRETAIVYFELGKPKAGSSLYARKEPQARLEAVCARLSVAGGAFCPILVVTDLQDEWTILWLQASDDGKLKLYIALCSTAQALETVKIACQVVRNEGTRLTSKDRRRQSIAAVEHPVLKRFKPLPKPDVANLEDIAEFCTPDDIIMAYKQQLRIEFPERFSPMYA